METDKHHRTTSNNSSTSELFVCFTSRLSSSSMKLSSKSILSPSRSRDQPQISLSSSLSRRLKSNGSMKGGQASPMFPTGGKKRGCGFENPEPSSPKVTCIGQVRVKTKKQGKKMRSRSKRRGEASFRRGGGEGTNPDLTRQNSQSLYQNHQSLQQECLKHRNQRWVHLPLTICEALREFSCFFPCRSSCMSNERDKEEKGSFEGRGGVRSSGEHSREGSCGAAFARWLVAYQDGDGKGREIEVMMEHHDEMEMVMDDEEDGGREKGGERSYSQRRHIFEDLDIDLVDEKIQEEFGGEVEEDEEKGRVSICVPPKNALLLMRCRSDPVKMAALANRFWESPIHKEQDQIEVEEHHQIEDVEQTQEEDSGDENVEHEEEQVEEQGYNNEQSIDMEQVEVEEPKQVVEVERVSQEDSIFESEIQASEENNEIESKINQEVDEVANEEVEKDEEEDEVGNGNANDDNNDKIETFPCVLVDSLHADLEKPETEETHQREDEEKQESSELSSSSSSSSPETFIASSEQENYEAEVESATEDKVSTEEEEPTHQESDPEKSLTGSVERENGSKKDEKRERETLPECLLLMMCEPKLSMEVSKETWVCSTDFIRWLPERPTGKPAGVEKKVAVESSSSTKPKVKVKSAHPPLMQPPRSSCCLPVTGAGMSMATMIEQKLVGCSKSRNGYEPFVLTRCKSEPMRSATKLAPEASCFWNNRKLEPHPPPGTLGVGAPAGVGF